MIIEQHLATITRQYKLIQGIQLFILIVHCATIIWNITSNASKSVINLYNLILFISSHWKKNLLHLFNCLSLKKHLKYWNKPMLWKKLNQHQIKFKNFNISSPITTSMLTPSKMKIMQKLSLACHICQEKFVKTKN